MSHTAAQDIRNHARYVPLFHFVAGPILLLNLIYSIVITVRYPILDNFVGAAVAFALVVLFLSARQFATTVQDRVIRLEEQIRFLRLFPVDLQLRIPEFTRDQFVALRFASDNELPTLARAVLDQRIHDRSAIKQMIKDWRADHFRA
jgi:hypothetical protein